MISKGLLSADRRPLGRGPGVDFPADWELDRERRALTRVGIDDDFSPVLTDDLL